MAPNETCPDYGSHTIIVICRSIGSSHQVVGDGAFVRWLRVVRPSSTVFIPSRWRTQKLTRNGTRDIRVFGSKIVSRIPEIPRTDRRESSSLCRYSDTCLAADCTATQTQGFRSHSRQCSACVRQISLCFRERRPIPQSLYECTNTSVDIFREYPTPTVFARIHTIVFRFNWSTALYCAVLLLLFFLFPISVVRRSVSVTFFSLFLLN